MNRRKRDVHEPRKPHVAATVFWIAMTVYVVAFVNLW